MAVCKLCHMLKGSYGPLSSCKITCCCNPNNRFNPLHLPCHCSPDLYNVYDIFSKSVQQKIRARSIFFLLISTLHDVSLKIYQQNKQKNGLIFYRMNPPRLERLNTPWASFKILPSDGARACKPISLYMRHLGLVGKDWQITDHSNMKERVVTFGHQDYVL